jgi:putative peptidoglycan lipid II flippase
VKLLRAFSVNSIGILTSRVLGFVRDMLTAFILGANIYSDIFFIAFKLPNLFRRIFAEGAFTQVFMPSYASSKNRDSFTAFVLIKFLIIIFLFSIFVNIFSPFVTKMIAFGLDEKSIALASPLVAINFYYLNLIFVVTLFASILQYKNHFATTAFATSLLNISLIVAMLIAKDLHKYEIVYYMSYAVLIGGGLQLLLHLYTIHRLGLSKFFILGFKNLKRDYQDIKSNIKEFNKNFIPAIFGNSAAQISAFLDTFLASFLFSGSISYFYYANRVFQLPFALFTIALSVALFPMITKAIASSNEALGLEKIKKSFWFLLYMLSLASIGAIVLSNEIVWLLFQRGEFRDADTQNTAIVLVAYMVGLVPFGLAKIFSTWLYASKKYTKIAKITAISVVVNMLLSLLLMYPMGISGIALASSLSGVILLVFTIKEFGLDRFKNILDKKKFLIYVISMIIFFMVIYFVQILLVDIV